MPTRSSRADALSTKKSTWIDDDDLNVFGPKGSPQLDSADWAHVTTLGQWILLRVGPTLCKTRIRRNRTTARPSVNRFPSCLPKRNTTSWVLSTRATGARPRARGPLRQRREHGGHEAHRPAPPRRRARGPPRRPRRARGPPRRPRRARGPPRRPRRARGPPRRPRRARATARGREHEGHRVAGGERSGAGPPPRRRARSPPRRRRRARRVVRRLPAASFALAREVHDGRPIARLRRRGRGERGQALRGTGSTGSCVRSGPGPNSRAACARRP